MKHALGPVLLVLLGLTLLAAESSAGEWGLGVGVAANQAPQQGADTDIVGGPFPFYEGERLSVGFGAVSYALVKSDHFRFALEGQVRFDGYDPDESPALAGMEERDPTFDAGFSIATGGPWGVASLKVVGDALGIHKGYEVSASYQYPIQLKRWTVVPSIGVNRRSAKLVDYYYGVRAAEAADDRPTYAGESVVNTSIGFNVTYKITRRWHAVGGAEYVHLGDSINASPIIEKDHEASVFSALVYRF